MYYNVCSYVHLSFICFKAWYLSFTYNFKHWIFSWNVDEENDLIFSIAKRIHFIKYKEHTVLVFGKKNYLPAPKYITE